jgi:peptidoglycan/xylan/chitin deacetylase (PgdA/CDA1 family)
VDPKDWRPGVTAKDVASVAGEANSGDVILLHDWVEQPVVPEVLDRTATLEALPVIVRKVRERGLTFVTVAP